VEGARLPTGVRGVGARRHAEYAASRVGLLEDDGGEDHGGGGVR
jgi:hypothetical protein